MILIKGRSESTVRLFLSKIINKFLNVSFRLFSGLPYSTHKATLSNRSFDSMSAILLWMLQSLQKKHPGFDLKGKKIAEIGTGQFLSHPIGFKLLGAEKVVSFDLYRQYNQRAALLSFSQQVMGRKIYSVHSSPAYYLKIMDEVKSTKLDLKKLELLGIEYKAPFDFLNYGESNDFDLVASYTVLEHVPPRDIKALLVKSIDSLKKGGHFCHYIDLEDHLDSEARPFDFLKEATWGDSDCYARGNRLRMAAWQAIFNDIGGVEYDFVSILRRSASLLPLDVSEMSESEISDKTVSGILVVGEKTIESKMCD